MLRITSQLIREWGDATFGEVKDLTVLLTRARQELDELEVAVHEGDKGNAALEAADVAILLHRLVSLLGADLDEMVAMKMAINRNRQWNAAGDGTGGHVKERYGLDLQGGRSVSIEIDGPPGLKLRPATSDDKALLELWDQDEDVASSSGNDHVDTDGVYENGYWTHELAIQSDVYEYFIAEIAEGDGWRPIGAIQIIDPHREPTHYWGEIAPNLRAIDIWLGDPADRGKGHGMLAMKAAIELCFASQNVTAVIIDPLNSNIRAHKFYQRVGFAPTHRQTFGDDDCLVHKLTRADWHARFQGD